MRLSEGVHDSRSLAALGIAAHEAGHALQHHDHYAPLMLRNGFFPVANIGSTLAIPLFFIGLLTSRRGPSILMDIGILLFAGAVVFSLVTLPVEFNASSRAVALLGGRGFLSPDEVGGARKVLSAAALTYVAATAMAVMQLVRLLHHPRFAGLTPPSPRRPPPRETGKCSGGSWAWPESSAEASDILPAC